MWRIAIDGIQAVATQLLTHFQFEPESLTDQQILELSIDATCDLVLSLTKRVHLR